MRDLIEDMLEILEGSSYYKYSGQSLRQVIDAWQKEGKQLYDPRGGHHGMVSVDALWPYREYTWTKFKARRTPKEWDILFKSMKAEGIRDTLHFTIGRKGGAKLGEGNHRLAIAREIGIKKVPVTFHFYSSKVTKDKILPPKKRALPPKVVKAVAKVKEKDRSPEERERLDKMVDMLQKFF